MRVDRDELLARIDLTVILDELAGAPARLGRSARWHCIQPGHDDHHPSVTVYTDRRGIQYWRCWSGGHGGTAIDAVTAATGCTIRDAIEQLAGRAGTPQPDRTRAPAPPTVSPDVPLHPSVVRYVDACSRILWTRTGRPVLDWLHQRGFADDLLRVNRVGCDPGPMLLRRTRGLPRSGLAAVLPALDENGEVTYVQARYLDPPEGRKYDNPAHHLGTNPRLAWPRRPRATDDGVLVVCEGIPDALTAAAAGLDAVAVLGTAAVNNNLAEQIIDHGPRSGRTRIVVAFDADAPGDSAATALAAMLGRFGVEVSRLRPPEHSGGDLNGWARHCPEWRRHIESAAPERDPTPRGEIVPVPAMRSAALPSVDSGQPLSP